jgi:hypothetical protein
VNITYTCWGCQIYFSHQAVSGFNDYITLYGVGSGLAGKYIGDFLVEHGIQIASEWLGPISAAGSEILWAMSKVDNGNGVYLNCILYVPCTITAA